jgi:hypothetical protein
MAQFGAPDAIADAPAQNGLVHEVQCGGESGGESGDGEKDLVTCLTRTDDLFDLVASFFGEQQFPCCVAPACKALCEAATRAWARALELDLPHTLGELRCGRQEPGAILAHIARCPSLESINLLGCVQMTDGAVASVVACCPRLHTLHLVGCHLLTDAALLAVASGCPELATLSLTGCMRLSDAAVQAATARCPRLRALHLAGLVFLTDASLHAIAAAPCAPRLHTLVAAECSGLADAGIARIASRCVRLHGARTQLTHLHRVWRAAVHTDGAALGVLRCRCGCVSCPSPRADS